MSVQGLFAAMALAALGVEAAASATPPGEAAQTVAKAGTPIELELVDTVSSRAIKRGDTFALKLAAPVVVDGRTLIPAGVVGVGQVVDAGKPGMGGKPAKLVLAGRRLEFDGAQVPIRSLFVGATGADETTAVLVTSLVPYAGIASIFIQGSHVVIPAGTRARAKLSQDFTPGAPSAAAVAPARPSNQ